MTTRLDRLFLLLDQGSSHVTRKAAALQIGEVQKLYPHELNNLLSKVRHYLHSTCWDTRIAASQAVEAVISNVDQWFPIGIDDSNTEETDLKKDVHKDAGRMLFSQFDVNTVIKCGRDLLASEGSEFDVVKSNDSSFSDDDNFKDKLATQRRQLNQRLGLDVVEKLNLGITSEEMISNEDLSQAKNVKSEPIDEMKLNLNDAISKATGSVKRIAKPNSISGNGHHIPIKKVKKEDQLEDDSLSSSQDKTVDLSNIREWPLESFSDELMTDLFSPSWEIRHGAATALREIVKQHGKCGGRISDASTSHMNQLNQLWLEDLTLRLLCVLALDKFGDYVSDQVVAPVRETCAQALGSVFNVMDVENINLTLTILVELLNRPEWEARHGGLLGLKYMLAIRQDMTSQVLPIVFQPVFSRLKDSVDDVSAVAAAALVPVKDTLIQTLPECIAPTVNFLWDALLEIDDLTSSTSNILMLLSSLLAFDPTQADTLNLSLLVPRLWPFLSHNMTSVRKSVLEALLIICSGPLTEPLHWLDGELLKSALCLLYQRSLVENNQSILKLLYTCWEAIVSRSPPDLLFAVTSQFISGWICLMMHPAKLPIDTKTSPCWIQVKHKLHAMEEDHEGGEKYHLGGSESLGENQQIRENIVFRSRMQAANFIGLLAYFITKPLSDIDPSPLDCFANIILFHLNSKSSIQKTCIALVINQWAQVQARHTGDDSISLSSPGAVISSCMVSLQEFLYYDEISSSFSRLQHDMRDFVATIKQQKFSIDESIYKSGAIYTFDQINELVANIYPTLLPTVKLKPKQQESLEERRRGLLKSVQEVVRNQASLSTTTLASLACAVVAWRHLPEKLNPVIRPLMDSVKREENDLLQEMSATHLVHLLALCCRRKDGSQSQSPVPKVIKNLVSFLCCDPKFTPTISTLPFTPTPSSSQMSFNLKRSDSVTSCSSTPPTPTTPLTPDATHGIITLNKLQKLSEKSQLRRSNSTVNARKNNNTSETAAPEEVTSNDNDESSKENEVMRRGTSHAIIQFAKIFGGDIPACLPQLWSTIYTNVIEDASKTDDLDCAQSLIQSLQVLEVIGAHLHPSLYEKVEVLFTPLGQCLENSYSAVRHMAARCFGIFSTVVTEKSMEFILDNVLNILGATDSDIRRQGAVEAISCVIEQLGIKIVPYVVLLVVPMLGRMSDQNEHVRLLATHCFAQLVQLMPLDNGTGRSKLMSLNSVLLQRKQEERRFLEQLLNVKKVDSFELPVPVKAELRSYQQEGVNWLAFLNRYKLHGILCDEMGLGKTLMSICILASDHFNRAKRYRESKSPDSKCLPSLVVCPPTLTGHWAYEVDKFIDKEYLRALHYTGPPVERTKLREKLKRNSTKQSPISLVVASYDIVRNDIDFFGAVHWNYCILDEGHIIKNGKTKLSKAIKSLSANHRLILTGTPIQNNVIELWSLFDFLMPGFLGSERQFVSRFSKPILQSRDAKSSSKEQEAGVLAMEALHRQVLPFILRRMKEDVLKDLPPKIIQDYYCELSPLQSRLYEDFAKSRVRKNLEDNIQLQKAEGKEVEEEKAPVRTNPVASHIFQALQYLRKVCNHPKLVVSPQHPEYETIRGQLADQNSNLSDINHAAKLCALKQLLLDCGIGVQTQSGLANCTQPVVNQHRALIFCQLKSMLDIVEVDLLKAHMPSVSYLRLDGSVPPGSRHGVVHRFNNDPSIDVLLLTTQVGGLGLNLTGADTVIFVEHDWNPMKDLQAMDRAHRIGQKKVVNVYRLVTSGTLEEKIMGLQKFKITIANTVISQENSSLQTMGTDQLLDLFTLDSKSGPLGENSGNKASNSTGMKSVLDNLPELWDSQQYDNEYDLTNFIQSLKSYGR